MTSSVLLVADGASVHTQRLAASIANSGWRVHLAAFEGPAIEGVHRHALGHSPPSAHIRYLLAVPRLARLIRALRPSVINAHYVSSYGVMARAAMRLDPGASKRSLLVVTAWGSDLLVTPSENRLRAAIAAWTLRGADLVTGDSSDLRGQATALAPRTDWHDFVFGPERALLHAPKIGSSGIVSARSLVPTMRVELIVRAFRLSKEMASDVMREQRLIVAGDGECRDAILGAAAGGDVDVLGTIDRLELHRIMLRSRVVVSVPETDASSAALLDGLAAGLIPVVNDLTANRQWADADIGEIVSRHPSVQELARALIRAVSRDVPPESVRDRVTSVVWEDQVASLLGAFRRRLG